MSDSPESSPVEQKLKKHTIHRDKQDNDSEKIVVIERQGGKYTVRTHDPIPNDMNDLFLRPGCERKKKMVSIMLLDFLMRMKAVTNMKKTGHLRLEGREKQDEEKEDIERNAF